MNYRECMKNTLVEKSEERSRNIIMLINVEPWFYDQFASDIDDILGEMNKEDTMYTFVTIQKNKTAFHQGCACQSDRVCGEIIVGGKKKGLQTEPVCFVTDMKQV